MTMDALVYFVLLQLLTCVWGSAECGQTRIDPDEVGIIGGNPAVPFSWPWQVALVTNGMAGLLQCGGSIIAPDWILTAAHCVWKLRDYPNTFKVRAGIYKRKQKQGGGEETRQIERILINPKFNHKNFTHDMALLKLKEPFVFSDKIGSICLPSTEKLTENEIVVTGWGQTGAGLSDILREVKVPLISEQRCEKDYGVAQLEIDPSTMFCAAAPGEDSCSGDSGGPAVVKRGDRWYQKGIVSWGKGCANKGFPGVYSRVTAYCHFIQQHTRISCK